MNGPAESGKDLLHKLHQIRENWAGGPPEALREALAQALRQSDLRCRPRSGSRVGQSEHEERRWQTASRRGGSASESGP